MSRTVEVGLYRWLVTPSAQNTHVHSHVHSNTDTHTYIDMRISMHNTSGADPDLQLGGNYIMWI